MSEQIKDVVSKVTETEAFTANLPVTQGKQDDILVHGVVKDAGRVRYGGGAMPF